jgi:hypothetical protein
MARRSFAALTFVVFVVTAWMAYANVLSDKSEFIARAGELARERAACKCNPSAIRVERGMTEQVIEYDFPRVGQIVIVCKRAAIVFGEYACTASR